MKIIGYSFLLWIALKDLPRWTFNFFANLPSSLTEYGANPGAAPPFAALPFILIAVLAITAPDYLWRYFTKAATIVAPLIVLSIASRTF